MTQGVLKKVLILGSGGLRIGQAGEFDYSGSQAIKALKQENIKTVLVNPNIATIQTDPLLRQGYGGQAGLADEVYLQPLNLETVTKIIEKERPDGLLLGFGGQTALNLGLALDEQGILKNYHVRALGTPVKAIKITEDRELFKRALDEIGVKTPKSIAVATVKDALKAAKKIGPASGGGYPVMMRSGYSLGGLGSGRITSEEELEQRATEALHGAPQILIEEYLAGWKEIEYEIVRDAADNAITVCNMENMDPMGIHTGESIVVAPSQTLTNEEYHRLREIAVRVARHIGIIGECNIQYALNPKTGDYRVIEMNARLSRSSALASKATGYPLAFVAAKLALGKRLDELPNSVTKKTTAFFEPALDYIAVKIPRWDLNKFKSADHHIGSEMKSVGEVMAIGRSFPEALQKAVRMLNVGFDGINMRTTCPQLLQRCRRAKNTKGTKYENLRNSIEHPTDQRLFDLYTYFHTGGSVEEAAQLSHITPWFLHHIKAIADFEKNLAKTKTLAPELLREAKQMGFGDKQIARLRKTTEKKIRQERIKHKIFPVIKQIDTLAGEFPAETNYLYLTYHGTTNDILPAHAKGGFTPYERAGASGGKKRPIIVLGSGPYCIGSSVEFDWCAVNTARTLREHKETAIIINSNPETVSTDYDESDRLYFEELTLERARDIADFERPHGIIVSVGGQIPNTLALPLHKAGYNLLGTAAENIDRAEDRHAFSKLLETLGIDQPAWEEVTTPERAKAFAERIGYPILVRPSYVLSGAAMNAVKNDEELKNYLAEATIVSPDHPVVISQFILGAKELEIDGVAKDGEVVIDAISEHIENAGVHSGDATIVLPPQKLYLETVRRTKEISRAIAKALRITGPFNIQFLAKDNELKVIECNLRASRSFPFVSKVTAHNFIDIAVKLLLGKKPSGSFKTLDLHYVGVKTPQFSYQRLKGSDPIARVEMASTGEVACIGDNYLEAFFTSWLATEQTIRGKRLLLSIGGDKAKIKLLPIITRLEQDGWEMYATDGTHRYLSHHGLASSFVHKGSDELSPNVLDIIADRGIDVIVNIPTNGGGNIESDGYKIRRVSVDHHIPLITNLQIAELFLRALAELDSAKIEPKSWREFVKA